MFTFIPLCRSIPHTSEATPSPCVTCVMRWGSTADKQTPHTQATKAKNWFQVSKAELSTEDYLHKAATLELVSCLIDLPFPHSPAWAFTCLLRLSESILENIAHERGRRDFFKKRKISHSLRNKVFFPASHCWQPAITHVALIPTIFMWNWSNNVVSFAFFCNTWSSWLFRSKIFV